MSDQERFIETSLAGERFEIVDAAASAKFWARASAGGWEPDTIRFIRAHCRRGVNFVDIGAWIGPISLLAGRLGARVFAFEPDPVAHQQLTANLTRNKVNAEIFDAALHTGGNGLDLFAKGALGGSETTSFATGARPAARPRSMTFDDLEKLIPKDAPVVMKIDIEGHEYHLADHITAFQKRRQAPLHLSVHPRALWLRDREENGDFSARLSALKETMALLGGFAPSRIRHPYGPWRAVACIQAFRRSRPKNYSVEILPAP